MKKVFFILLLSYMLLNSNLSFAQTDLITLSSDLDNVYEDHTNAIKITNTRTAGISGEFISENSVLITPFNQFSIAIRQQSQFFSTRNILGTGVTIIKIKKPPPPPTILGKATVQLIKAYPNPVQNDLTFNSPNELITSYTIFDLEGVLKIEKNIKPTNKDTINVNDLNSGNYILQLNNVNGQQLSMQFIKN